MSTLDELLQAGVEDVFRETVGSALDLGVSAMRSLGFRGVQALRAARIFKELDEFGVRDLARHEGDEKSYVTRARQHIDNLERVLQADRQRGIQNPLDEGWEIPGNRNKDAGRG